MDKEKLTTDYDENINHIDKVLRVNDSFDMIKKDMVVSDCRITFYYIDGFVNSAIMQKLMMHIATIKYFGDKRETAAKQFADQYVPAVEVDITNDFEQGSLSVMSGCAAFFCEGFGANAIIIDARTYPVRSGGEPENDRVLRGPHDGFVETLVFNTALIRRRIRDTNLTMEIHTVGKKSKTDVCICFMKNRVNRKMLDTLRKKLDSITVNSLTMGQQSLIDCLVPKQWFNPFPKVRYTERPDAVAASVLEGSMVVITDNSPAAMIIPSGIFDFLQDTNDYYMSPVIGSYMRIIRMFIFAMTMLLIPIWLVLIRNPQFIPEWLEFIKIEEEYTLPIVAQLYIVEVVIDAIKLASINTPQSLSGSFGVIGALVLGEFAVSAGWFVPEVVLYMAFVALTNFTQPSFELGYAFKLFRMMFIALIALFDLWGFAAGILIVTAEIAATKTVTGQCYLYPLIPFNGKALLNLLLRRGIREYNN